MPIKNGTVFCINHPSMAMTRNRGFNAITTFERTAVGFGFNASTGMPIVAYFCNECGYVETYAAQKTQFWSEIAGSVDPSTSYKLFESTIRNALDNLKGAKTIEENVRLSRDGRMTEVDLIMRTPEAVFVFEVKTRLTTENIAPAVRHVRNAAKLVEEKLETSRPVFPIIVVPNNGTDYQQVEGVKILRFDFATLRFANSEILDQSAGP